MTLEIFKYILEVDPKFPVIQKASIYPKLNYICFPLFQFQFETVSISYFKSDNHQLDKIVGRV